jgi:all-trans-retinol 13,14-reductase
MTNSYYLGQPNGELYGLDHAMERFSPWSAARLRPTTDIPGLYLTGQDIMSCGITGSMYSGLLTSSAILNRNTLMDLIDLHQRNKKKAKKGL